MNASDGIEHGHASWDDIWRLSRDAYDKTAFYLRQALLGMLDLGGEEMAALRGARFRDVLVEEPRYWEHGIFEGDLIKQWMDLDFRIVETAPFIKSMNVDDETGTYAFTFDWDNEFNYQKRLPII